MEKLCLTCFEDKTLHNNKELEIPQFCGDVKCDPGYELISDNC